MPVRHIAAAGQSLELFYSNAASVMLILLDLIAGGLEFFSIITRGFAFLFGLGPREEKGEEANPFQTGMSVVAAVIAVVFLVGLMGYLIAGLFMK